MFYREYPDGPMESYATGAGLNQLTESVNTRNYYSANVYANYEDTFGEAHHVTAMAGFNYERMHLKNVSAAGQNLTSTSLDDLDLVGQNAEGEVLTEVGGGQNEYALAGFFGRVNYDYKGRYLLEAFCCRKPLGILPFGFGGMAYLRRAVLQAAERICGQPEAACFVW